MLVLSRQMGETLVLILPSGEKIVFKMLQIRNGGSLVRVGIDAPEEIKVIRGEKEAGWEVRE